MAISWQAEVFNRLRDREWHKLGALFEEIETQIPLHYAMRSAMQRRAELPTIGQARWQYFLKTISMMGIESDANPHIRKWTDKVRLRYVDGKACAECGGPVIKMTWKTVARFTCLCCSNPPPPQEKPTPPPPPAPTPQPDAWAANRERRLIARALKHQFYFRAGTSINEIERLLQRMSPQEVCAVLQRRWQINFQARPRPPPRSSPLTLMPRRQNGNDTTSPRRAAH